MCVYTYMWCVKNNVIMHILYLFCIKVDTGDLISLIPGAMGDSILITMYGILVTTDIPGTYYNPMLILLPGLGSVWVYYLPGVIPRRICPCVG